MRRIKASKSKKYDKYSRANYSSYNSLPADAMIVTSEVTKIESITMFEDGKVKTAFYCKSKKQEEDTLCVYWGSSCLEVGDVAYMKGRLKSDGVFLCWNLQIIKKEKKIE